MTLDPLIFWINGSKIVEPNADPEQSLLQFVRSRGLTGSKLGCAEGGCGACTVLVSSLDRLSGTVHHSSVNACLAPVCSMQDKHVITIEGIGNSRNPHPVQERLAKFHGSQCGFCTPGIAMSLYALLRNNPYPSEREIEEAFDGNLCRCTGYRPILDASRTFACSMGDKCCRNQNNDSSELVPSSEAMFKKYDPSLELIFPPALKNKLIEDPAAEQSFKSSRCTWIRPVSLERLLELKSQINDAKLVCGNTEVGIEMKFKNQSYRTLIYPMDIPELQQISILENGVEFGACLTLSNFVRELKKLRREFPKYKTRSFRACLENLKWFAGNQIRNVATIAGNIATASPISDLNPVLLACEAVLKVQEYGNEPRLIKMSEFFLGYRKTALKPSEILLSVIIPFTRETEFVFAYKQAKRRDDDIAIVTSGMSVRLDSAGIVQELRLGFGGMGAYTVSAPSAEKYCIGKHWDRSLVEKVSSILTEQDLKLSFSSPGGLVEYRRALACSFFFKFFVQVAGELDSDVLLSEEYSHATDPKTRPISTSKQVFHQSGGDETVGKSVVHTTALKQVTGEAQYVDDTLPLANEVYAGLILSTKSHAKIKKIDITRAEESGDIVGFVFHGDVPGTNIIGPVFKDEQVFVTDTVQYSGQLIGLVLAKSQIAAQRAAKLVRVEYEDLPAILTIEEAIEKESFFPISKKMEKGIIETGFQQSDHIVEGEIRIGGQNHFYLETQASIVIPSREDDEITIISSTQNPTETQHLVADVLGIASNMVVCKVKRLGGGFGGKETQPAHLSCALAVASKKFNRPVRCMLDRDEDMILTGERHPFLGKYRVGFNEDGKIHALDIQLYSNGGWSADLSIAVMERAVAHSDNVYNIPHIRVQGTVCKTNVHSNTAFRGFGGPQGMAITETWINHIAEYLKKPVDQIQEMNMYREGDLTHFNQPLEHFHIPQMWKEIRNLSDFEKRKSAIEEFNNSNKWKKRGISIIPTKFGIAFTARFLNQAGALVHIYTDGSVLLTHGGTEMGQGLHTKMIQIAADELGVSVDKVHISETATDKVANTSPTAASASADLNGMAILDACNQINERLKPYRSENPGASFEEIVKIAYFDRVNLSANGFYKTPDLEYDWSTNSGRLFNYFTFGVAVAEVEIDTLTGDFQILRSDVAMDLGKSMNPAIDVGQIEGAFVQGIGWSTIEETLHFPNGQKFTRGPGNYKIPGFQDIPIDFRVTLLPDIANPRAVHSSKAVGEPPLFLGASAYFAIRDAVRNQRQMAGSTEYFRFDLPATPERIRMACLDPFSTMAKSIPRQTDEKEWVIRV